MSQTFTDASGTIWTLPELVRAAFANEEASMDDLRALHYELTLALDESDEEMDREEAAEVAKETREIESNERFQQAERHR